MEQEATVYPPSIAEQIVSSTLFFPSTLNDWFNFDLNIRNSESTPTFKVSCFFLVQTNIYNIFDPKGLTFLTHLRLGLSHLND